MVHEQEAPRIRQISTQLGKVKFGSICRQQFEGGFAQALADEFEVSKPSIQVLLRSQNVTVRPKRLDREQIAQAATAFEFGKSIAQIAKLLEFNPVVIWWALKMQGFEMRPKGFQPKGRPSRLS